MSTTTRNYRLVQPLQTEEGKVQTYNDNFGKIEAGRTLQRVAGVTVAQYQAVYLDGLGKMQLATDSSASPRFIVAVGANASAIGYCQVEGVVTNGAWTWTVGGLVYCHASTGGALTQTAPGPTSIPIGVAVSATELFLLPFWITGASAISSKSARSILQSVMLHPGFWIERRWVSSSEGRLPAYNARARRLERMRSCSL